MIAGLYIDGTSPLHRAGAGIKILAMIALGTGVFLIPDWPVVTVILATVLVFRIACRHSYCRDCIVRVPCDTNHQNVRHAGILGARDGAVASAWR